MRPLVVVAAAAVLASAAQGNQLNDYLRDKTFGAVPGPCPTFDERCEMDWKELPQSIKDINVCILSSNSGCGKIGDLVKAGEFEIWDLQCKRISIGDITMSRVSTGAQDVDSRIDVSQFRLACSFQANVRGLVLEIANSFRVITSLSNTRIAFPYSGYTGAVDTQIELQLETDKSRNERFTEDLPFQVFLPADKCKVGINLGLDLSLDQINELTLCAFIPTNIFTLFLPKGWQCGQVINGSGGLIEWLIGFFNIDSIVSVIVRILEAFIGGIICQIIEETAVLSGPPERDGILNEVLKDVKNTVDGWAATPPIDPAPADLDSAILAGRVTAEELASATNFANSTVVEALSVGLNNWLAGPSTSPGYVGKLVINELIDQATNPDGYVEFDLVDLDLAPEVTLPLNVADVTVRLNKFALDKFNSISSLALLQNAYDQADPTKRMRYTFVNAFLIDELAFQVQVYMKLAPGTWVTAGTRTEEFTFTFSMAIEGLSVDAATRVLFNFDKLNAVRVGQITGLVDLAQSVGLDPDKIVNLATDALQCVAPAFYDFTFTDLEASLAKLGAASITGEVQSQIIEDGIALTADVLRGALSNKLPGIMRSIVRTTANDLLEEYVTGPGRQGTQKCPAWVGPTPSGGNPAVLDFSGGLLASASKFIDDTVGGSPIVDSSTDINELVDVVLSYYADNFAAFPVQKTGGGAVQGKWELAQEYKDFARLSAFQRPADVIHVEGFQIDNLNSIYRLRAAQLDEDNGGLLIDFGVGGELAPVTAAKTPLKLRFPVDIKVAARPADGDAAARPAVDERFAFELVLAEIGSTFALTQVAIVPNFVNALYLSQLRDIPCLLGGLATIEFRDTLRSLAIGSVTVNLDRERSGSSANPVKAALDLIGAEAEFPAQGGRFVTLVNTVMRNGLSLALDTVESLPELYARGSVTPENCSAAEDPLNVLFELGNTIRIPNATELLEGCLAPVDFGALPPIQATEDQVEYDESKGDEVFDIEGSALVSVVSGLLDDALKNGGLDRTLKELANATGSAITDLFEFDEGDPSSVNVAIPLSILGLRFANDDIIPGLVVDAGVFKIKGVNKFLNKVDLLNPLGTFTTQHRLEFDKASPLDVEIEALIEMDRAAVDGAGATGKVREEVSITFNMKEFVFDLELVTAINPKALSAKSLGHFFRVDEEQTIFLADSAVDCLVGSFYKKGLVIRKMQVDVAEVTNVAIVSRTNELLTEPMEALFVAVADIVADFYKDALTSVMQNCLREFANSFIADLQEVADCPAIGDIAAPPLEGDNAIMRFSTQADYALFQDLFKQYVIDDNYVNLNAVLATVLSSATFLSKDKGDAIELVDQPFVYYGTKYGSVDLGISNLRMGGIRFSNLRVGEPYSGPVASKPSRALAASDTELAAADADYAILTAIELPGPAFVQFDLVLNARDLFPSVPEMRNNIRVKLTLEQFLFQLLLVLKINLVDAMQLQFSAISSLQELPCLLIPLEELRPEAFDLNASSITAEITCLDVCEFPFFGGASDFKLQSENGEQVARLLIRSLEFATAYLDEVNAQALVDAQLEGAEKSCAELIEQITGYFTDATAPADIATTLGTAIAGTALLAFIGYGAVYPIHKMRRKQTLLANLASSEKSFESLAGGDSSAEMARIMVATELSMKSIFQHPVTPLLAKFGIPFLAAVNLGLLVVAVAFSGALSLVIRLTLLGAQTELVEVMPITVGSLINVMWEELGALVGIIIAFATIVFPVLQNMTIIGLWFIPSTIVRVGHKRTIVELLELTGKIGFVLVFVLAVTIASLYTVFNVADYNNLAFVPGEVAGFELNVQPKPGMILLAIIASVTLVISHVLSYYLERTAGNNQKLRDEIDGVRNSTAAPTKALHSKRSLFSHAFVGRDTAGCQRSINPTVSAAIVGMALVGIVLIMVGMFIPCIVFEVNGLAGIVLREVSEGSPTLESPLELKEFSLAAIGAGLSRSPTTTGAETLGIFVLQITFFIVFVIAPVVQLGVLVALMVTPLSLRAARYVHWFERVALFWSGLDLACFALAGMLLLISPLVQIYVNEISSIAVSENLCYDLESVLALAVPDAEKDAFCMDVTASLRPGFAILVGGLCLQFVSSFVFSVLAAAALSDRYYAAFHTIRSDARPKRLGKISVFVLNLCTRVTGTPVEDSSAPAQDRTGYSIFNPAQLADESPSCLSSCLRYYACCVSSSAASSELSETDRRIEQWRARFESSAASAISFPASDKRSSSNPLFGASGRAGNPFDSFSGNPRPSRRAPRAPVDSFASRLVREDSVEV